MSKKYTISEVMGMFGKRGGKSQSRVKVAASRRNGKKGGRPNLYANCSASQNGHHRFSPQGVCYGCHKSRDEVKL